MLSKYMDKDVFCSVIYINSGEKLENKDLYNQKAGKQRTV